MLYTLAVAECLRGELRSLRANVEILCGQMHALQAKSTSTTATTTTATTTSTSSTTPPNTDTTTELRPEEASSLAGDLGDGSGVGAAQNTAVALPREHLKLEVQVQSQFQLLWAVFQSHSTAEDEVIWPALKEKARSSGGKVVKKYPKVSQAQMGLTAVL